MSYIVLLFYHQGLMKTAYLHALYLAKPVLLPVFSFLLTWARSNGFVKSEPKDSALMATAEFYAFFLLVLSTELPTIGEQVRIFIFVSVVVEMKESRPSFNIVETCSEH